MIIVSKRTVVDEELILVCPNYSSVPPPFIEYAGGVQSSIAQGSSCLRCSIYLVQSFANIVVH